MKIKYRPEIDGLRAISVISVILYHLEIFINSKNNYTLLDKIIYPKIKGNSGDLKNFKNEISKQYYDLQQSNVKKTNNLIREFLDKEKIKYLDPFDYSCDEKLKQCDVLTNNNAKIYWDYGHYTLEGSYYFGKKIKELNWLKM